MPRAVAQVPGVIFDSDMSSDHDDIADLAVLEGLADLGECNILACMSSSQNGASALCMSSVNTYYGRPNIPCGRRPDQGGVGGYPAQIASEYPHPLYASYTDCPLAVDVYRQVLASQPDHSVIIVTAGYLNNIQALLQSGPDQYSSLSGSALVAQKVKLLSCAGGNYPSGDEFNFKVEPAASHYAINNWTSSAFFDGYDIGQDIYTGGELQNTPTTNPIRRGFELTFFGPYPSWTQIMIYYAVRNTEAQTLWKYNTYGHNVVDATGHNTWTTDYDPTGLQEQGYLIEVQRYPIQQALDTLVMNSGAPKSKGTQYPPNQPSNLRATVASSTINLQWSDDSWNETGFTIERKIGGVFTQIATVGANVTTYSDTGLASTANVAYRVSSYNALGRSGTSPANAVGGSAAFPVDPAGYAKITVYSNGWTETNLSNPADHTPIYNYYQYDNLNWARGPNVCNHVTVNNDSTTGQDVTINVMVGGMGAYGRYYVYFLYQDQNNWYRLNTGSSGQGQSNYTTVFEKCVNGTITQLASNPNEGVNIGNGSLMQTWQIVVSHTGSMQYFSNNNATGNANPTLHQVLSTTSPLVFATGKIALGSDIGQPVWDNFSFDTTGGGGSAPAAPTGLTATAGNTQVSLNWTASSGATSYNVYRGTSAGGESTTPIITGVTGTTYTNTGLTNGTAYFYKVAAVNGNGTSGYSNEASATPTGSAPAAPTSLTATAGNAQVSLSWTASSGATSYNVYRGTSAGGESTTPIITGITGTTSINTGLTNGTTYFYKVAAVNGSGTSGYSNEASATPTGGSAPAAPAGLTATAGNAQVSLSWTASSGATSYNVYRGTTAGGESATPVATGITGTTYTNTGLTNGTAYFYKVAAVNGAGTSGYSNEASATPTAGGGGGAAFANASFETPSVSDYTYTPAGSSWTFTNNAGIQHNGSAYGGTNAPDGVQTALVQSISGTLGSMAQSVTFPAGTYTISFQAAQRFGQVQPIKVSVDSTVVGTYSPASNSFAQITTAAFTVTAGSHTVTLAATDNSGDKTIFVDLVTIAASGGGGSAPAAPTGLSAAAGNTQVSLNWTASSGATSYNVYRGTSAGGESATPVATGITGTTYTNTGLTNGTAYFYKVAAVNGAGTSGYSNEASATPTAGSAPAAPTGLGATAGNTQITLSWTASSGATSYNVYRGTTAGGEGTTPVATGITGTTYTNTGLTNGTAYYYKVAAVNGVGTSGYSNEASATPTAGGGGSNTVANASFETPSVGGYTYSSTGTSWTFTNNAGIQHNGSAYSGSGPVAPDGIQTGFVQGVSSTLGSMAQGVSFTAGSHTISFQAAQRYGQVQPIKVSVDGNVVGTYTPASSNYAQITTASFTVTAGSHTVTFAATDSSSDRTSFIDLVSVN